MKQRRPIAFKLTLSILCCAFIIVAAIVGYNYTYSKQALLKQTEENSRLLAQSTTARIDAFLASVQQVAEHMAISLADESMPEKDLLALSRNILAHNPEVYGIAVAFEPKTIKPEQRYYAPYHFRSNGRIAQTMLGDANYRYFYMDWYQIPKEMGTPIWTEPYFDEGGGGVVMATYAVPFYRNVDGKTIFAGVVTADISLERLREMVSGIRIFDSGFAFLLSHHGTFISHPDKSMIMNQTIFSLAEERGSSRMRELGKQMLNGESAFISIGSSYSGEDSFLFSKGLEHGGWAIGILFPKGEMLAEMEQLSKVMTLIGLAGFFILALVTIAIARRITHPLRNLSASARVIASGNLDTTLPETSNDEVGDLAASLEYMKGSLKEYIANLTDTTAAKERIESELRIARDIQMGILPKLFPAFPERKEFEVFASIEPAKEVGGDLYDFFFIDDDHFCFLVGDVSGKGVPAAFFMAVTKTLLKVVAEKGLDPGEVLTKVNADLAADNESCMFVTLFLAIMNIHTGETRFANAGHNPPIYMPSGKKPEWIPPFGEPVAGIMDTMEYSTKTMTMHPGDIMFIYTDGVTEAMDPDKHIYSDDRLMNLLESMDTPTAPKVVGDIAESITVFAKGAEQSDDITMLAMQFMGNTKK
ncbi:SpoIIE family protein phosphatase [Pseudodesulfovibrio sediminis]|uniref:IcfG protein n=1 Tax=Pseudodesulfovibrio sediminis TaxID=2810563 RepID=A0ABN6EP92_9BACT|nr:SpoIIE family protein phosphatase [Pseudodesulfovibrio sediminis]BCS88276.1 IcfG protein [Pseudodesulfovibrio sediminis]